ncbi:MAG: hypothetical protein K9K67_14400 [Bacteriovoracaceae bacterium]|nr:hypothetical protein [Bacteriovoracaceae bacterium]
MKICNEIEIKSTIDEVWKKTVDVESWPSWNPIMNNVVCKEQRELAVGSTALIDQKGMKPCVWTIQELKEKESFSWKTSFLGIKMLASHELSSCENFVKNKLTIEVEGLVGIILWPLLKKLMLKTIVEENLCFKVFCESKK